MPLVHKGGWLHGLSTPARRTARVLCSEIPGSAPGLTNMMPTVQLRSVENQVQVSHLHVDVCVAEEIDRHGEIQGEEEDIGSSPSRFQRFQCPQLRRALGASLAVASFKVSPCFTRASIRLSNASPCCAASTRPAQDLGGSRDLTVTSGAERGSWMPVPSFSCSTRWVYSSSGETAPSSGCNAISNKYYVPSHAG
jgi:hypothetical protein